MSLAELALLAVALLAGWLWLDTVRARDVAVIAARRACEAAGVQLLDETVAGRRVRPVRNEDGQLQLAREYRFEFSDTGNNRREGSVVLHGHRVIAVAVAAVVATES